MMRDSDDNTSVMRGSDDNTSMMRNSPFQDGDNSDDFSVHSDTAQDALRDNSEPAALVYSEISDEDDDDDVITIVISEDELTVTQPESIRCVTNYFALRFEQQYTYRGVELKDFRTTIVKGTCTGN